MTDPNNSKSNADHAKRIQAYSEQSNSGDVPKQKLIKELEEYKEVLAEEKRNSKNQKIINELTSHLGRVKALITDVETQRLEVILKDLNSNEKGLIEGIRNLKKQVQVSAKSKDPNSLQGTINQAKKLLNLK